MNRKQCMIVNSGLIVILLCFGSTSACNFSASIVQDLWMDGFHRNMTYTINIVALTKHAIPKLWAYSDCIIAVHQALPAGLYANPDEILDFKRTYGLDAITKKTNVELVAHHAEPSMVYIMKEIRKPNVKLWVPLHARYHKAVSYGGYAINELEEPKLYMRCPDRRLEKCARPLATAKFLCATNTRKKCFWKAIPFIMKNETPVRWQTPVGDLNHYYPVTVVTVIAVTFGSVYLLMTINEFTHVYNEY